MRWTVYLDESGTHDTSPILVMGGAAATASQWESFDKQWEAVLEREQLPYIHYVDFVGRRKIYQKYSTPEIEKIGRELTGIALSTIPLTVSAVLRPDDYHSIYKVEETQRYNPNSQLGVLFRATASFLPSYITDAGLDDRPEIDFIYEAGGPNSGDIAELYRLLKTEAPPEWGERLGTLTFVKKGQARGLELADGVSFASLRLERAEHGSAPTEIEVSTHVIPDGAEPPASGTVAFRVPISRRNLADLKDNLLLTRGSGMKTLPPKNPRTKKAKPGSAKASKIVQRNLSDAQRISKGVRDTIKIAMADAIMAFSDMEMSAEQFIWDLLGLSPDDGKLVTRIDTKDKIELAKKFSERYGLPLHPNEKTTADAWTAIRDAIEARNKMAHGVWMTIDLKTPIVVSYRIPIELGRINSEHFPLGRIEAVTRVCIKAKGLFDTLCLKIATEGRPAPPPLPPTPDDPEI